MQAASIEQPIAVDERSWRYAGWRVVAVLFLMQLAIFGFGMYGHGLYVAELRRLNGWSTGLISAGSTLCLVLGSLLSMFVSDLLRRIGPRALVLAGIAALAASLLLLASANSIRHLFAGFVVLGLAWVGLGTITTATIAGAWFDRKRGLAISLAFTGATFSGLLLMPGLILLVEALGFRQGLGMAAIAAAIVLVPLVAMMLRMPQRKDAQGDLAADREPIVSRAALMQDLGFIGLTASFAFAVMVQVAFIVHQISILTPLIGLQSAGGAVSLTTAMALAGRISLAVVADRIAPRPAAAISMLSQAAALAVIGSSSHITGLYLACAVFGFSIGNLVTLPALVIQREFASGAFGTVLGLSMAIAGVVNSCGPAAMGLLRDWTGGYATPIMLGIAVYCVAALGVLIAPRPMVSRQIGFPA